MAESFSSVHGLTAESIVLVLVIATACPAVNAQSPPAPITSSGLNTKVSLPNSLPGNVTQYDITGGTRAGTNLFHSFGNFNVPNNNIANFLNDAGLATTNILSRVTAGNASNIFGSHSDHRFWKRQSVPDESRRIFIRSYSHRQRRWDGHVYHRGLSETDGWRSALMRFPMPPRMRF